MTDGIDGQQVLDSVPAILKGMTATSDPLVHYRTVFRTPAVKCTWFSCRREFLHGILDSLLGKHVIPSPSLFFRLIQYLQVILKHAGVGLCTATPATVMFGSGFPKPIPSLQFQGGIYRSRALNHTSIPWKFPYPGFPSVRG
jgi:hypothetical protein